MTEVAALQNYIYAALSNDATVTGLVGQRIYPDMAPEDDPFPRIVFQVMAADDMNLQGTRIQDTVRLMVKATDEGQHIEDCDQIMVAVESLLHPSFGDKDIFTFDTHRLSSKSMPELVKGNQYRSIIAMYEVFIRPI